jgi:23S rRNA (guanosine2251-2'-O)-methyltransferase
MRKRDFVPHKDARKSRSKFRPDGRGHGAGRDGAGRDAAGKDPARKAHSEQRRDERPSPARAQTAGEQPWRRDKPQHDRPFKKKPPFKKAPWRPAARDRDGPVILYGWHSVKAALENPARKFHRLLATENALHRLTETGMTLPITPKLTRAEEIEALVGPDAVHQGILAEVDPLASPDIDELMPQGLVLVLDHITDPHNVGAILRSAAAFGVEAVIMTSRHSPEATGVLAKAASAALEHVPLITVPNLARALEALKDKNVFVVGLDSSGDADLATVPLRAPLALVVGAEGKGLRQLTRSTCDAVARIALPGRIKSLNVSNATALALFVASGRIAAG